MNRFLISLHTHEQKKIETLQTRMSRFEQRAEGNYLFISYYHSIVAAIFNILNRGHLTLPFYM